MKLGKALEALNIRMFGTSEENELLEAVQEGEKAAKIYYNENNEQPTNDELLNMGYQAKSGDVNAFTGGFITSDFHKKHQK